MELEEDHSGDGWSLSSYDSPGQATFSYKYEGWSDDDEPTDETEENRIRVSGTVTIAEDGTLAVELSDGW